MSEPRFQCRACMKELTKEEATKGKLQLKGAGFWGHCPKCNRKALFFSIPEPQTVAVQNQEFQRPLPSKCPKGHEGKIERWGLAFRCHTCTTIFSS